MFSSKKEKGKVKIKSYIILIVTLLIYVSCDEMWIDNGPIKTKEIKSDPFTEVIINDVFDVELIQDTIYKIEVIAGSKIVDNVDVENENNTIKIKNTSSNEWLHEYERVKLKIYFTNIDSIILNEPCTVFNEDTIHVDNLLIHALGEYIDLNLTLDLQQLHFANSESSAGVYTLKGKTNKYSCWVRGSGILKAEDFLVQNMYLRSQSISDCYVHVENNLTVYFENTGYIYYKGNPSIVIETPEFSNQLIKLDL